jgi:hypothetical protein
MYSEMLIPMPWLSSLVEWGWDEDGGGGSRWWWLLGLEKKERKEGRKEARVDRSQGWRVEKK